MHHQLERTPPTSKWAKLYNKERLHLEMAASLKTPQTYPSSSANTAQVSTKIRRVPFFPFNSLPLGAICSIREFITYTPEKPGENSSILMDLSGTRFSSERNIFTLSKMASLTNPPLPVPLIWFNLNSYFVPGKKI